MRARDWILIGAAGVAGFAVVALCIVYAMSFRGARRHCGRGADRRTVHAH